jgi:hypothetical protein
MGAGLLDGCCDASIPLDLTYDISSNSRFARNALTFEAFGFALAIAGVGGGCDERFD